MMHKRVSDILKMKGSKKIVAITAYDYTMTLLCQDGVDVLLVGDSAGMVMLGHSSTLPVTMEHMCMFTGAVSRARKDALVVADMPFLSYHTQEMAVRNAGRLVQEGADAVKVEGNVKAVRAITEAGIPVMGHIGLQPQDATLLSGFGVRGKTHEEANELMKQSQMVEGAGAFCVVLEKVERQTAGTLTKSLNIPTIGIGSGGDCDGQILVAHDMLGMYPSKLKFVKKYDNLADRIKYAISQYKQDVEKGAFPAQEHTFGVK